MKCIQSAAGRSINRSINQPINPLINQSFSVRFYTPFSPYQSTHQSINQSMLSANDEKLHPMFGLQSTFDGSIDASVYTAHPSQSTNQSMNQSTNQSTHQSAKHSFSRSTDQWKYDPNREPKPRSINQQKDPIIDEILRVDHAGEYGAQRIYDGQIDGLMLRSLICPWETHPPVKGSVHQPANQAHNQSINQSNSKSHQRGPLSSLINNPSIHQSINQTVSAVSQIVNRVSHSANQSGTQSPSQSTNQSSHNHTSHHSTNQSSNQSVHETIDLIKEMRDQEIEHLRAIEQMLPEHRARPSALLPAWHVGGWLLGFVSGVLGPRASMAVTVAVEEVITEHYNDQLRTLAADEKLAKERELRGMIRKHRDDEEHHRMIGIENDAEQTLFYGPLSQAVKLGTQVVIEIARKV